jgi:hypothetical protein
VELIDVPCDVATVRRCAGHGNGPSELFAWDAGGVLIAGAVAPCLDDPAPDLLECIIRAAPVDLECYE